MYSSAKPYFYGTGRRKKSVARVRLYPGSGVVTINGRDIDDYFGLDTLKLIVNQPFGVTETEGKFDIVANVKGGGFSGQAGAIRHGVARALLTADENYKLLSEMGVASRRECAAAAKAGQVLVDGVPVKDSARHVDPEKQKIIFRGREITYAKYVYVMLNKPEGYVSATEDTRLPVVTALLSEELQKRELFPVLSQLSYTPI